jgi:hypothetical protein
MNSHPDIFALLLTCQIDVATTLISRTKPVSFALTVADFSSVEWTEVEWTDLHPRWSWQPAVRAGIGEIYMCRKRFSCSRQSATDDHQEMVA